jgi:hypothetical protein
VVYYNVKAKAAAIVEQKALKKVNPTPLKSAAENVDEEGSSDVKVNPPPLKSAVENVDLEGSSDVKVNPPPLKSTVENVDLEGSSEEEHEESALAREPLRMTTRQKEKQVLAEMGNLLEEVTENDLQDTEHVLDKIRTGEMKDAFQVSPLYQQGAFG